MIDNRYAYDKHTGDRLGEEQWQWLDQKVMEGKNKDVRLTLIGAGVQILPDRRVIESFTWSNKNRLFKILS